MNVICDNLLEIFNFLKRNVFAFLKFFKFKYRLILPFFLLHTYLSDNEF